jgi:hyperosmotically inducible protein
MSTLGKSHKRLICIGISAVLATGAVTYAAAPDATDSSASVGAAISDTAITTQVKAKFATDDRLKGSDLSVTTNNGVVTLTGTTPSSTAKEAAETLASNVSGVRSVNNQLAAPSAASEIGAKARHATERTTTAVEDTAVTADLKTKFTADSRIHGSDISVTTKNSIVALSGTVISEAQKTHAIYVARHTKGVTQVDSTALTVSAQ